MSIEQIKTTELLLNSLGFKKLKRITQTTKIAILIDGNRVSLLEDLEKRIPGSHYNRNPISSSSVGSVNFGDISILVKPKSKQGNKSAGIENEIILVKTINKAIENSGGPLNVLFHAGSKKYLVENCVKVKEMGRDTTGRKKADIILIDNKKVNFPVSIKKDNAEIWESADKFYAAKAKIIVEDVVKRGLVELTQVGSIFRIVPNVATPATISEKKAVVFGSDLEKNGSIITRTFSSNDFKLNGLTETFEVKCSHIITQLSEVKGDVDVFFLIRNDKTRKIAGLFPGLRVLAVFKKRINRKMVVV